jgi:hypothetical protein
MGTSHSCCAVHGAPGFASVVQARQGRRVHKQGQRLKARNTQETQQRPDIPPPRFHHTHAPARPHTLSHARTQQSHCAQSRESNHLDACALPYLHSSVVRSCRRHHSRRQPVQQHSALVTPGTQPRGSQLNSTRPPPPPPKHPHTHTLRHGVLRVEAIATTCCTSLTATPHHQKTPPAPFPQSVGKW